MPPKEEVACPQGWHVTDGWRVDVTGAVDEAGEWVSPPATPMGWWRRWRGQLGAAGWEYGASAAPGSPPPAWHATEKTYHTHRRRRWLRTRRRDPGAQGREQDVAAFLRLVGTVGMGMGWWQGGVTIWGWRGWGVAGFGVAEGGWQGWGDRGGGDRNRVDGTGVAGFGVAEEGGQGWGWQGWGDKMRVAGIEGTGVGVAGTGWMG